MAAAGLPLPQHQGHHDVLQLIPAIPRPSILLLISLGSLNKLTWPPQGACFTLHTTLPRPLWGLSTPHCGTSSICLAAASLIIFPQDADTCSCIAPLLNTYGIHFEPPLSSTLFTMLIMILDSLILEYTPILLSSIYSCSLVLVYISNCMTLHSCLFLIHENLPLTHNASFSKLNGIKYLLLLFDRPAYRWWPGVCIGVL